MWFTNDISSCAGDKHKHRSTILHNLFILIELDDILSLKFVEIDWNLKKGQSNPLWFVMDILLR